MLTQVESFKIAKEISSLNEQIFSLNQEITQEQKRITFLQQNRSEKEKQKEDDLLKLADLRSKIIKIENDIASHHKKLSHNQLALKSITSHTQLQSLEKEIKYLEQIVSQLEDQGLTLLEELESIEFKIKDVELFLEGSMASLNEITIEVNQCVASYQEKIQKLEQRIDLLLEELPKIFKDKLLQVLNKKIPHSCFTRVINGSCEFCRLALSRLDISEIEDKLTLKSCAGCSRIYIPEQAIY